MAYPNTSDFTLPTDDGVWWLIRVQNADGSQSVIVCSTNGRAFVNQVQSIIGTGVDGQWGTATSTALLNALRAAGADAALVNGVQAEATIRQPGVWSTAGSVWLIHHIQAIGNAPAGIAFGAINIPSNTVFPVWNTASQLGPSGSISPTCSLIPSDATQTQSPTQGTMPDQSQIQVNPMTYTPAPVDNTASQIIADSLSNTIGIGMWVVAGVVVLVAGAFVLAQMNPTALPMLAPANGSRMRSSRTRRYR